MESNATPRRFLRPRVFIGLAIVALGIWIVVQIHESKLAYFVIASESMEPTLKIGDRLIMKKSERYQAGDIVVFSHESAGTEMLVKRIVAVEGEMVFVNGDTINVKGSGSSVAAATSEEKVWTIGPGEVFVLGDNRSVSKDSRVYGPIPLSSIRGKIRYRMLSLFNWETVK